MAPRRRFFYVFSKDPPSAEVLREDQVRAVDESPLQNSSQCFFSHEKAKDIVEDVGGVVLQVGEIVWIYLQKP